MKLQRIVVALAVVLALGVLALLLRMSQAQDTDVDEHHARQQLLEAVSAADAELDAMVSRARLQLDTEPAQLAPARVRLETALYALGEGTASLAELSRGVPEALIAYGDAVRPKLARAQDHEAALRAFIADFQALRRAHNAVLDGLTARQAALRQNVTALMREVLAYAIASQPENAARIDSLTADLRSAAFDYARDGDVRARLDELVALAAKVQSGKDQVQDLTEQVLAAPAAAAWSALNQTYEDEFRARESAAGRYQLILGVYVAALLLAFGALGLRLRASFTELDRANAALRDTNVNLEKTVDLRTRDLRKALDDLKLQQAQLIQSEKMASLGQMVAGVAHEINTPLGYVRSNVGIVRETVEQLPGQDGESRAETLALLGDADHGLAQIADLVMTLKNFSRVDRSQNELFDVNEGLDTALKICHNRLKNRIEVTREYAEVAPIHCAPSQLNQVFLNVLTNASQAIAGEGTIRIRTADDGDSVMIAIADSGQGMDEATRKRIFEPFFTTKEVGQGTGLGLAIVFRIVQDHGGRIDVVSAPGKGSEFILSFPKRRTAVAAGPAAAPAAAPAGTIPAAPFSEPLPA